MAGSYVIIMEGLPDVDPSQLDPKIITAARQAINKTADRARTRAATAIGQQVNFPARYLSPSGEHLVVGQKASNGSLEAVISGRSRPTSLARFKVGKTKTGVLVSVKPGVVKEIKNAFFMPLRQGDGGPNGNLGLAVRTARGKRPSKAYHPVQLTEHLWLLYGPSVDQVFKTVREDIAPETSEFLAREFSRLIDLGL